MIQTAFVLFFFVLIGSSPIFFLFVIGLYASIGIDKAIKIAMEEWTYGL